MKYLYTAFVILFSVLSIHQLHAQDCDNDTIPPTPVLHNGIVIYLENGENQVVYAEDFDAASYDNCSDSLSFQLKVQNTNEGFQDSLIISEELIGTQIVDILLTDQAGNWRVIEAYILIDYCEYLLPTLYDGEKSIDVTFEDNVESLSISPLDFMDTTINGCPITSNDLYIIKGAYTPIELSLLTPSNSISFDTSEIGTHILTIWSKNSDDFILFSFQVYINLFATNGQDISCDFDTIPPIIDHSYIGFSTRINGAVDSIIIPADVLVKSTMDNCDAEENLIYRVVKSADADGSVPNADALILHTTSNDLTTIVFELWVGDQSGNWNVYENYVRLEAPYTSNYHIYGDAFLDYDSDCSYSDADSLIAGLGYALKGQLYRDGEPIQSAPLFAGWSNYGFDIEYDGSALVSINNTPYFLSDTSGLQLEISGIMAVNTGCQYSYMTDITNFDSPAVYGYEIGMQAVIECPSMHVDIAALQLRRCIGNNYYYVSYANYGSQAADSYVTVQLDDYITYESSTIPWSTTDNNTYTFPLGIVGPLESGQFNIEFSIDCDAVLGQTHCSSAYITPDTLCNTPPYDGARIAVEGWCDDDSGQVRFQISNQGDSDMQNLSDYIVVEDVIMLDQNSFDLEAGQNMMLDYPANGSTYRLEVGQVAGYPGLSMPSASVEGCGLNEEGTFTTGIITQFQQDELDPFISIDCQQNIGSYDPNDKQGYPIGVGEEHFIAKNSQLDYRIRFQNTGTDTAFTVIILDTLSTFLDAGSVRPGASSHAYTFQILEDRILEFRFDDILLPDSTTNLEGSQGFVQFSIMQIADNPDGTLIENDAAIYFDLNEPIITNTTFHQIGEVITLLNKNSEVINGESFPIKAYPNPFSEKVTVELPHTNGGILLIYQSNGQQIERRSFNDDHFDIYANQLKNKGLYLLEIFTQEGAIYSAKLLFQ